MDRFQLPKITLRPQRDVQTEFQVGDEKVDAVLLPTPDSDAQDYAVGVTEHTDEEGLRARRYLKLPKRLHESKHVFLEVYEDHDTLIKGVGAVAVIAGAVKVGSLFVRRIKK